MQHEYRPEIGYGRPVRVDSERPSWEAAKYPPPKVIDPGEGCRFRRRCPLAIEKCAQITPRPEPIGSAMVACHVAVAEAEGAARGVDAASLAER